MRYILSVLKRGRVESRHVGVDVRLAGAMDGGGEIRAMRRRKMTVMVLEDGCGVPELHQVDVYF